MFVNFRYRRWIRKATTLKKDTGSLFCLTTIRSNVLWISVDKKIQLDVTFSILYFSSNSCSTCFGQPCAHHQELTTAWCYRLVLVCAVAAGRWSSSWNEPIHGRTNYQTDLTTSLQPQHIPTQGYNITQSLAPDDGHMVARNMLSNY